MKKLIVEKDNTITIDKITDSTNNIVISWNYGSHSIVARDYNEKYHPLLVHNPHYDDPVLNYGSYYSTTIRGLIEDLLKGGGKSIKEILIFDTRWEMFKYLSDIIKV